MQVPHATHSILNPHKELKKIKIAKSGAAYKAGIYQANLCGLSVT